MAIDDCIFRNTTLATIYCDASLQGNVKPEMKFFYTLF